METFAVEMHIICYTYFLIIVEDTIILQIHVHKCAVFIFPQHGKARFVVLFTDYLLVLKAKRPSVPSKWVFTSQSSRIDWFSDLEYTAKKVNSQLELRNCALTYVFYIMIFTPI